MNIRFILNPHSGKLKGDTDKIASMASAIQLNFPGADMRLTKAPGHATELAQEAARAGFDGACRFCLKKPSRGSSAPKK